MSRRRNLIAFTGGGSTSRALGDKDPRNRRNNQALGAPDIGTGGAIRVDKNARLTVQKAA